MTLAEVIALINSDIVPNGNNEITANVLRPILIEMLQQPNDLIGELDELNTVENDTLVKAINSVNNALSDVDGLTILSGQGDPNQQSFPSLSIADLYSEIDGLGSPLALWIYDGTKFIRLSDKHLSYEIPQTLTPIEQLTARNNIGALDVKMAELSSDLTESEKAIIKSKLGIDLELVVELVVDIPQLIAYEGQANVLVVKDSLRGGVFVKSEEVLTADNGVIFDSADDHFWAREFNLADGLNILWYGADPTGIEDNAQIIEDVILFHSAEINKVFFPKGDYRISRTIGDIQTTVNTRLNHNVEITGSVDARIFVSESENPEISSVIGIDVKETDFTIKNITLDGNNIANRCLYLRDVTTNPIDRKGSNFTSINASFINANTGENLVENGAAGINLFGKFDKIDILYSKIDGVTTTKTSAGTNSLSGISIGGLYSEEHPRLPKFINIVGNKINNVKRLNVLNWSDQDGIKINNGTQINNTFEGNVIIRDNVISNCGGRFVKTQVNNVKVLDNTFIITEDFVLPDTIVVTSGVNIQYSGGIVSGNTFIQKNTVGRNFLSAIHIVQRDGSIQTAIVENNTVIGNTNSQFFRWNNTGSASGEGNIIVKDNFVDSCAYFAYFINNLNSNNLKVNIEGNSVGIIEDYLFFNEGNDSGFSLFASNNKHNSLPIPFANTVDDIIKINNYGFIDSDDTYPKKTEDETIDGSWEFELPLLVPDAVEASEAVNLGQLNTMLNEVHLNNRNYYTRYSGGVTSAGLLFKDENGDDFSATSYTGRVYDIRLSATATSNHTGARYVLYHDGAAWNVKEITPYITSNFQPRLRINSNGLPEIFNNQTNPAYGANANVTLYRIDPGKGAEWKRFISLDYNLLFNIPTSFPPSAHTHPISDITYLQDELDNKANTDGSNTTGGVWNIERLTNNEVGSYVNNNDFTNAMIGIPSTDALGSATGVILMRDGAPIAIAENENTDWDGYIYRAGTPLSGYPANQQNGNYLIESKHRFRFHPISSPDSTSGTAGFLKIQPFNGIEHSYYRVTFTGLEIANIDMDPPNTDELTGFSIERNAIGQKCTVAVSGSMKEVKFTNVSGVDFSSAWNKGVFEFYWTGTDWIFGGYSPIEP